jgi:DNA repair protein RadC
MPEIIMKSDKIKNWPVKERPRERLIAEGAERQSDADLLAIILRVGRGTFKEGVLGQNAPDFARELLKEFKGLRGLDRAHIEDLKKVPGIGIAKAAQIKAAFELGKRVQSKRLTSISFESSSAVAAHFRPRFVNARQEIAIAILLNGQNQLIEEKVVADGTPTQATVYVRRVLEEALRASAAAFVLVHNHPSGNSEPTSGDDETTRDLERAARLIGLLLLDHIIIGEDGHYSYADSGRLQEISNSEGILI